MKTKLKLYYLAILIKLHWILIKNHRKKLNRLLEGDCCLSALELLKKDKPLNYHCTRVLVLEQKYKSIVR